MPSVVTAFALGFGAGISPGPLLTLVLTSTLQRGFGAGLRVALAPLLTDTPIVVLAVAVVGSIDPAVTTALGIAGGSVVIAVGLHTMWQARGAVEAAGSEMTAAGVGDVWRGVVVNLLSPHPWIFWFTAGAPLLVTAWRRAPIWGVLFLVVFYALLVGLKVAVAWGVSRGARKLGDAWRRRLLLVGGAALAVGGAVLLWQAAAGRL